MPRLQQKLVGSFCRLHPSVYLSSTWTRVLGVLRPTAARTGRASTSACSTGSKCSGWTPSSPAPSPSTAGGASPLWRWSREISSRWSAAAWRRNGFMSGRCGWTAPRPATCCTRTAAWGGRIWTWYSAPSWKERWSFRSWKISFWTVF